MRSARQPSLRWRIFWLAAVMLAAAATLLIAFIHDYAQRASDRAFDRLLSASALSIAGSVLVEDGAVSVELPVAAFDMVSPNERVFYVVIDPSGRIVTGYEDLSPLLPLASATEPVFSDDRHNGEDVRIATVGRLISAEEGTGWVTIRVAETRGARAALAAEIFGNAVLPVALLAFLALGIVWIVVGRAMAPLAVIDKALRERRPDDLSPVIAPVPVEVQTLVEGLNGFMARLRLSSERLAGLVAEAAHQVRNPLASLRAQAELAQFETDGARLRAHVDRIHDSAVEASHLVSQLLMDATISHRMEAKGLVPVSVSLLVEEVVHRLDPDQQHRVTIAADRGTETAVLMGDKVGLREMLKNLIDNARIYTTGQIDITMQPSREGWLRLSVLDRGPGIPPEDRARVLERFVRGAGAERQIGSGLGLAIVRRVVEGHGGMLELSERDGGGLAVHLLLPVEGMQEVRSQSATSAALLALGALLFLSSATAEAQQTFFPAPMSEERQLVIAGTTDTDLFTDFITAYQISNPTTAIAYAEVDSLSLYEGFLAGSFDPKPDLLISSASDLQIKLANDGHALPHPTAMVEALPDWAQWRAEVIGFTFEPAVIVYNPELVEPGTQPRTHRDLAEMLESDPARFQGRVATYDIARSGVGHLLAAQDQQISTQFWRVISAMGRARAVLSDSSPEILDWVAAGEVAIAYNVLGSYAFARQAAGAPIGIVVPDDYVLVLTRTMLIPRNATNPDAARSFVDFALSSQGQSVAAGRSALGAIVPGSSGSWTVERISAMGIGAIQPISIDPVLLIALDPQRRRRFLTTWSEIVAPGAP